MVPQMMALAEGKNFKMAQEFALQHGDVLLTATSLPQMYQIETQNPLPEPIGYLDLQYNITAGFKYLSQIYSTLYNSSTNQTIKNMAQSYWLKAEGLAEEGDYIAFYFLPNPAVNAICYLLKTSNYNISNGVNNAIKNASSLNNLWKIETAAEAAYLYDGNMSDKILATSWAALSLSINVGPSITPYGFYEGLYNAFLIDIYAAEYYDSVTGSNYGNVTLLTNIYNNPNVLYDYGFFNNYYAELAINFSNYFLKQLNSTSLLEVKSSIYNYMKSEDNVLENAAAYYDGPSIVGYLMMTYGIQSHNIRDLYYAMPFIRNTMNTEQLTWYNSD
ncbi:hypothetical protein [Acidianus brierleyi]|nr:hypothetical protein [Acidianus brierleyi]AWR93293.2 hypothetical protein DFR85_00390 [Acidianus brierleyi]